MGVQINCGQIEETNSSSMPFLNVWMMCARLKGVEVKQVDPIEGLQRTIHKLGFSQCLYDYCPERPCSPRTDILN